MGNVMDRSVSCAQARSSAIAVPAPLSEKVKDEQPQTKELAPNLMFHLYSYRQQINFKKNHFMKWATSKLLLTEELLKLHNRDVQSTPPKSWIDFENAMFSDDEEVGNDENRAPAGNPDDPWEVEFSELTNYRLTLRGTIVQVAQEKMKKRERKKLKRLKRRTLISSKKPSNKDKYQQWQLSTDNDDDDVEPGQVTAPEVIVID
ncbi:hypothetical protein KR018_001305 [Drosophila ironensis]|nr:hypothetical protein KR018_001305 [Drosophila ironensis]